MSVRANDGERMNKDCYAFLPTTTPSVRYGAIFSCASYTEPLTDRPGWLCGIMHVSVHVDLAGTHPRYA
jgi:hypothetical protein